MKAFFLVLVLGNVLFFAWSRWHAPTVSTDPPAGPQAPALALAGESASSAAAIKASMDAARCQSIGPFLDLPDATRAAVALRDSGHEPKTRAAEGEIWAGLWVYLPNLPSRAEAQRVMGILRQNGMNDAYLMPSLTQSNDISLGIFSEPPRAQRRAEDVRRLGFNPTVADHTRKDTVYWLDVALKAADLPIDPANLQRGNEGGAGRIMRLEVKPCPRLREDGAG